MKPYFELSGMKKKFHAACIIISCMLLNSCATHAVRVEDNKDVGIYPATYRDSAIIILSVTDAQIFGEPIYQTGLRPLMIAGSIIDLPVSLVTDTIFLPHDIAEKKKQRERLVSSQPATDDIE